MRMRFWAEITRENLECRAQDCSRAPFVPKPGHMTQSPRLVSVVATRLKGKILSLLVSGRSAA
jgi:hypothetical protein